MAPPETTQDALQSLIDAAGTERDPLPPVERWEPDYCGEMDLIIKRDGSWWHEGTRITRQPLIRLFSRILRKDADGRTYLVTPVEKIAIQVEAAPFLAVRCDVSGEGEDRRIAFLTNMDEAVAAGPEHPIRVEVDAASGEPEPFVHVRGRLEALMTRACFYDLAEHAEPGRSPDGSEVMGVRSRGAFFPLGPRP